MKAKPDTYQSQKIHRCENAHVVRNHSVWCDVRPGRTDREGSLDDSLHPTFIVKIQTLHPPAEPQNPLEPGVLHLLKR
jgi:hypothetical protein